MATQNRPLPDAESARADVSRTIEGIYGEDFVDRAFENGGTLYKKYVAKLSAENGLQNPPIVLVLENTIGEIVWSRIDVGSYNGTSDIGTFTDKTWLSQTLVDKLDEGVISIHHQSSSVISISSMTPAPDFETVDGFGNIYIEIRVYN